MMRGIRWSVGVVGFTALAGLLIGVLAGRTVNERLENRKPSDVPAVDDSRSEQDISGDLLVRSFGWAMRHKFWLLGVMGVKEITVLGDTLRGWF